ncbi:MAG: DUF1587 domain-containing protein, partial [Planctomycetota bacterium]
MRRITAVTFLFLCSSLAWASQPEHGMVPQKHIQVLREFCFDCHDSVEVEGGVNLEDLNLQMADLETAETWQKVLNVLNSGEMPPKDYGVLPADQKTELLADLSQQLVVARETLADTGGVITMRRLNRREYKNTIEALLGVSVEVNDLPDDSNPGGFDTDGSSLFFSSDQFERYLDLASHAIDKALAMEQRPERQVRRIEAEDLQLIRVQFAVAKIGEKYFSEKRPDGFKAKDLTRAEMLDALKSRRNYRWFNYEAWLRHPGSLDGTPLYNLFNDFALPDITLPDSGVGRRFVIRIRAGLLDEVPEHRRYIEYGSVSTQSARGEVNVDGARKVGGTKDEPETIEFEFVPATREDLRLRIRQRQTNSLNAAKYY